MNRQELSIVILLFLGFVGWMMFQARQQADILKQRQAIEQQTQQNQPASTNSVASASATNNVPDSISELTNTTETVEQKVEPVEPEVELKPEITAVLENDLMEVTFSSHGGAVKSVELNDDYPEVNKPESGPVHLDFSGRAALSLEGVEGLSTRADFQMVPSEDGRSLKIVSESGPLSLERNVTLGDGYVLTVADKFSNRTDAPVSLENLALCLGPMQSVKTTASARRGYAYLGLDTFYGGKQGVVMWAQKGPKDDKDSLAKRFQEVSRRGGCAMFRPKLGQPLPAKVSEKIEHEIDWMAIKNKFFVQIAAPEDKAVGFVLDAARETEGEDPENARSWNPDAVLSEVSGKMFFKPQVLQPGEIVEKKISYYVGPKKFDEIARLDKEQDKVMFRAWKGWGWFRTICIGMLWTLNAIYKVIPNYGVAIILLTIIVKILFWPFMHKSTENMKKMQEIQPEIAALKEKYPNDPQKLQRETMALYNKHGVNPLASCLPMFFQMPVFISLFIVLRSAVELRFAPFLWIADLSEPENLLYGMVPIAGSLNLLPLLMTATMIWQQKLTPSGGDPQQQKMMMIFMPCFMLLIMYKMPSALTLYWTVSQVLSIVQLIVQRKKKAPDSGK